MSIASVESSVLSRVKDVRSAVTGIDMFRTRDAAANLDSCSVGMSADGRIVWFAGTFWTK